MRKRLQSMTRWLRPTVQAAFVLLAAFLGLRRLWGVERSFDATCPFGGAATIWQRIAHGVFLRETGPLNLVLLGVLLIVSLFFGRAFCAWACPLGTVQEGLSWLVSRLTKGRLTGRRTLPAWLDRPLRFVKVGVLAAVVWASATAVVPPLIPFCPYRTLFTLNLGALLGWSVIAGLVVSSVAVDRFWCRYLCPLGALLAPTNRVSLWRIRFGREQCIACGRCDRACPVDLDVPQEVERGTECIRCMACVQACPRDEALQG